MEKWAFQREGTMCAVASRVDGTMEDLVFYSDAASEAVF